MNHYNGFSPAQRLRALAWLKGEYAAGRRRPPSVCDGCGATEGIKPHSEDYREPYGAHIGRYGVCHRCHMMIHQRFFRPAMWQAFRQQVGAGTFLEELTVLSSFERPKSLR